MDHVMGLEAAELRVAWRDGFYEFPVHHVRGGTSTGLILWKQLVPPQRELQEELLRLLMGVPLAGEDSTNRQLTGLGRVVSTSNKVFIADVAPESGGSTRIVATFAQLAAATSRIDWGVNCGNMTAALPLWALDMRLMTIPDRTTAFSLDILNTNTNVTTTAKMLVEDGCLVPNTEIPGVPGRFPGVELFVHYAAGSKTGVLLPTTRVRDTIEGIDVSCVDVAVPMVIARASDFGKTGYETPLELERDRDFTKRLRAVWTQAGLRMGLRDRRGELMTASDLERSQTIPKVCLVAAPRNGGTISARYFTPQSAHRSMAVSGACCLGAACVIPGTVASAFTEELHALDRTAREVEIGIENPAGVLQTRVEARTRRDGDIEIIRATYLRSAQILLRGNVPLYGASPALNDALAGLTA